ncbi:MAG: hypothetical protein KDA61_05055, partial [Planctomycetales bacterium]|nr:hypothetical protein [Planctomycetales bacterium]
RDIRFNRDEQQELLAEIGFALGWFFCDPLVDRGVAWRDPELVRRFQKWDVLLAYPPPERDKLYAWSWGIVSLACSGTLEWNPHLIPRLEGVETPELGPPSDRAKAEAVLAYVDLFLVKAPPDRRTLLALLSVYRELDLRFPPPDLDEPAEVRTRRQERIQSILTDNDLATLWLAHDFDRVWPVNYRPVGAASDASDVPEAAEGAGS